MSCTDAYCGPFDCIYLGETHSPGSSFPARDGCNTCTCQEDGTAACTELDCACDPSAEWWRSYVSEEPNGCDEVAFSCVPNTTAFANECGCGCEQAELCAEQYDCLEQGCNVEHLREMCPYSEILE